VTARHDLDPAQAMKINVIGTSGSGKSTLARSIAGKLGSPYIELDALFWRPGWKETPDEAFFPRIEAALARHENWVLDGNYTRTQPIKWRNIDMIVWIDYALPRTLYQAVKRATTRAWSQQELWPGTGNRESFQRSFLSRQSIILWTLRTHAENRRKYEALIADPNWQQVRFVRLRSPQQTHAFMRDLT
jgi:adenylate kinase family enzyme